MNTPLEPSKAQQTTKQSAPAKQPTAPTSIKPAPTATDSEVSKQDLTTLAAKKILLVDDDMRNTFALSRSLKSKGLGVIMAADGKMALDALEKEPDIDIVLMDIMMPIMDGYEAITKIRSQERFTELPIIALTAKVMKGDKEKCIEVGASDFLAKPIDLTLLLAKLKSWLIHG